MDVPEAATKIVSGFLKRKSSVIFPYRLYALLACMAFLVPFGASCARNFYENQNMVEPQQGEHTQRIAVIGSGIAGMACAHYLSRRHQVCLFEGESRLGGHTATQAVQWQGVDYAVDMGFIVYNDWTYPNFIRLLNELNIRSQPTVMGFSVTQGQGAYEYAGANLNSLFAQRRNLLKPAHWRMLLDIVRFNKQATGDYLAGQLSQEESLGLICSA